METISKPAIIFAFITFFSWAFGNVFAAIVYKKLHPYKAIFLLLVSRFLILTFLLPLFFPHFTGLNPGLFILNIILGVIFIISAIAESKAIHTGIVSLNGTIIASFSLVSVLISLVFLGEKITMYETIAIMTIVLGIILSGLKFNELKKIALTDTSILIALLSAVGFGIYFGLIKSIVTQLGWFLPAYITLALSPFLYILLKSSKIHPLKKLDNKLYIPIIGSAIFLQMGDLSFNYAVVKGLTSVVAPIAGAAATLFVLVAYFLFKEKLSKQQVIGIVITLIGIILLSIFSI